MTFSNTLQIISHHIMLRQSNRRYRCKNERIPSLLIYLVNKRDRQLTSPVFLKEKSFHTTLNWDQSNTVYVRKSESDKSLSVSREKTSSTECLLQREEYWGEKVTVIKLLGDWLLNPITSAGFFFLIDFSNLH